MFLGMVLVLAATIDGPQQNVSGAPQKTQSVAVPLPAAPPAPSPQLRVTSADGSKKAVQISGYVSDDDYPIAAALNEEEGTVTVQFTISDTGSVASCKIAESSGSPELDGTSCGIVMQRFRYEPALDKYRKPQWETKRQRIAWRLPDGKSVIESVAPRSSFKIEPMHIEIALDIDSEDKITACRNKTIMIAGIANDIKDRLDRLCVDLEKMNKSLPMAIVKQSKKPRTVKVDFQISVADR
ncbi:MAG: energy transducer TonB [Chakrabartia sp.]